MDLDRRFRSIENQLIAVNSKLEEFHQWQNIMEPWLLRTFNMDMTKLMKLAKAEAATRMRSYEIHSQSPKENSSHFPPEGIRQRKRRRSVIDENYDLNPSDFLETQQEVELDPSSISSTDPLNVTRSSENHLPLCRPSPPPLVDRKTGRLIPTASEDESLVSRNARHLAAVGCFVSDSYAGSRRIYNSESATITRTEHDSEIPRNSEKNVEILTSIKSEPGFPVPECILSDSPASAATTMTSDEVNTFQLRQNDSLDRGLDFEDFNVGAGSNAHYPSTSTNMMGSIPEFQGRVTRALHIVKSVLKRHEESLKTLMKSTEVQHNGSQHILLEDVSSKLPITTIEEMNELEFVITRNEALKNKLIADLGSIGGYDMKDVTNRIMNRLLTNEIGEKYGWVRTKEKLSFSTLALKHVVSAAVKQFLGSDSITEKEVEELMKLWLKYPESRRYVKCEPEDFTLETGADISNQCLGGFLDSFTVQQPFGTNELSKKKRSSVYAYYDYDENDGRYHCKQCSACYAIDKKTGSTSALLRHTRKHMNLLTEAPTSS